jgi:hypothetical protein
MPNELIDFWKRYNPEKPPFVPPDDIPVFTKHGNMNGGFNNEVQVSVPKHLVVMPS